jgi:hypothetical protein
VWRHERRQQGGELEIKQPTNEDEAEMILIMMQIAKAKQIRKRSYIA